MKRSDYPYRVIDQMYCPDVEFFLHDNPFLLAKFFSKKNSKMPFGKRIQSLVTSDSIVFESRYSLGNASYDDFEDFMKFVQEIVDKNPLYLVGTLPMVFVRSDCSFKKECLEELYCQFLGYEVIEHGAYLGLSGEYTEEKLLEIESRFPDAINVHGLLKDLESAEAYIEFLDQEIVPSHTYHPREIYTFDLILALNKIQEKQLEIQTMWTEERHFAGDKPNNRPD